MLKIIKDLLLKVINEIDSGNSELSEKEAIQVVVNLRELTDRTKKLSKYESCRYLNISRATFDNYIRAGKIPKGRHEAGFKELSWEKKDLDIFIKTYKL